MKRLGRAAKVAFALFATLVAAAVVVAGGPPAFAHARLVRTEPPGGAVLSAAPREVRLTFEEPVEIIPGSVRVVDAGGRTVALGNPEHPSGMESEVAQGVRAGLAAGAYVVTWRVVSADSHPVHGVFTFVVGGAGSTSGASAEAARLDASQTGSRLVGAVYGVARALVLVAVTGLIGSVLLLLYFPSLGSRRVRRAVVSALVVAGGATLVGFVLQGPYGSGQSLPDAWRPALLSATAHSRYGEMALLRLAVLAGPGALIVASVGRLPAPARSPWAAPAAAAAGLAVLASLTFSGHAAQGGAPVVGVATDLAHAAAASVWVGGLALLALAGRPAPPEVWLRFSRWALASVAVIVATGIVAAWRQVGFWGALTDTGYGALLLAKIGLLAALVGLGALSRARTLGSRSPWRTVVAEAGLGVIVLMVTAQLVNARPARQAYFPAVDRTVTAGPDRLAVHVPSTAAGAPVALSVSVVASGRPAAVPEVDARLTLTHTSAGVTDSLVVPLQAAGPGRFTGSGFSVPIPGEWRLNVTVRTSAIDEYYADPITIRFR